jgi:hypothetical protein
MQAREAWLSACCKNAASAPSNCKRQPLSEGTRLLAEQRRVLRRGRVGSHVQGAAARCSKAGVSACSSAPRGLTDSVQCSRARPRTLSAHRGAVHQRPRQDYLPERNLPERGCCHARSVLHFFDAYNTSSDSKDA